MLREVPNVKIIRGNTDSYICNDTRPRPSLDDVKADINLLKQLVEVEGNFSWSKGAVTSAGWLAWLSRLPIEYRDKLPDGTQVLCVHASPNKDDGSGINQNMSKSKIDHLLLGAQERLICVGHTHRPFSITVNNKHIVNPGSISNPLGADVRASYAMLEASELGYKVEFLRVDYDQQAVIEILEGIRHPARRLIIKHLRGERA
jgi:predicted phosphodiesterase